MASKDHSLHTDQADLYTCGICLEHMGTRNPRLLSCHHSFCEDCMKKLVKDKSIICPSCRNITAVLQNDVTTLSINFFLLQVLEREREREIKQENKGNICQFCNKATAENICEICSELLCNYCTIQHNKVQQFKNHKVRLLCSEHFKAVTHICMQCCVPVCVKCIVLMHGSHEAHVKAYANAMDIIQQRITEKTIKVQNVIDSLCEEKTENEQKIQNTEAMKAKFEAKRVKYFLKMKKYEKVLADIEINSVTNDVASRRSYSIVENKWYELAEEIRDTFGPDNVPILDKVAALHHVEKAVLNEIKQQPLLKHIPPPDHLAVVDSDEDNDGIGHSDDQVRNIQTNMGSQGTSHTVNPAEIARFFERKQELETKDSRVAQRLNIDHKGKYKGQLARK